MRWAELGLENYWRRMKKHLYFFLNHKPTFAVYQVDNIFWTIILFVEKSGLGAILKIINTYVYKLK